MKQLSWTNITPLLDWVSRLILAAVFLFGGIPKLFDTDGFAEVVGSYGLLPEAMLWPVALFLPILEVVTAVGILLGRRWAMYAALGMLLMFIGVLSYGVVLGLDIDCGCFSVGDPEHEAFSGLRTAIVRDLVFLVPLFYLLVRKRESRLSSRR